MGIIEEIKKIIKQADLLTKLIIINLVVFICVNLFAVILFLFNVQETDFNSFVFWTAVPSDLKQVFFRPWTIITYMFLHEGFFHLLFNMLFLYWFGQIFVFYIGVKRLLTVYLLGGISGAILYIAAYNIFPVFGSVLHASRALGASASVTAIIVAIAIYRPYQTMNFIIIGPVRLIYIALFFIVLDVIQIKSDNAGGHIAHLGGAIFGFYYIVNFHKGKNIAKRFESFLDTFFSLFNSKPKMKVSFRNQKLTHNDNNSKTLKKAEQEVIDRILEKIKRTGYDSLTKEEKETLFNASKK